MQQQKPRPDRSADVLMTLHKSGWMGNKEIADEVGATIDTIRKATLRLEREGRIKSRWDLLNPQRKVYQVR